MQVCRIGQLAPPCESIHERWGELLDLEKNRHNPTELQEASAHVILRVLWLPGCANMDFLALILQVRCGKDHPWRYALAARPPMPEADQPASPPMFVKASLHNSKLMAWLNA